MKNIITCCGRPRWSGGSVLVTGPRFAGSNPAEDDGFLSVIKTVARLPSERKQSRRSHVVDLRHLKEPYKHERDVL
jgi:hypothetical protein